MTRPRPYEGREPTAEARVMATELRNIFIALRQAGFSERLAMAVVTTVVAQAISEQVGS